MIAPTIEPSHPAGEIVALPDNRFSRNPPTNEPTMPNTIVPTHPIGSGPGTRNRAITPTIAPTMMKPMMPMMSMQSLPYVKYRRAGLQAACLDASGAAAPQNERVLQALETLVIPVLESPPAIDRAERWFARYGDAPVSVSRLLRVVRTFISLPAGIARMPLWRFVLFSLLGAVPWTIALVYAGKVLGDNWRAVRETLGGLDYIIAAVILALVALFVWRHARR